MLEAVAQLEERWYPKPKVVGSNPNPASFLHLFPNDK